MAGDMDRMRSLLSDYYGIVDGNDGGGSSAEASKDIDSPVFDAPAAVHGALKEKSLPELVAYADSLQSETKTLDGKMQNLVYENYNKFISATDAIRTMKASVDGMESEMSRLVGTVEGITESSSTISEHLAPNRSHIEKLVRVRRLLSKLEFLFELPARLKRSIELEAYAQAVRYFNMASGVLTKYGSVPSLKAIHTEAEGIMSDLRQRLRSLMADDYITSSRLIEAIRLQLSLQEPVPALRVAYIKWHTRRLTQVLEDAAAASAGDGGERATMTTYAFVRRLNDDFLDQYINAATAFLELFNKADDRSDDEGSDDGSAGSGDGRDRPSAAEAAAQAADARAEWVALTKTLFAQYFALVKERLCEPVALPLAKPTATARAGARAAGARGADGEGVPGDAGGSEGRRAGAGGGGSSGGDGDGDGEDADADAGADDGDTDSAGRRGSDDGSDAGSRADSDDGAGIDDSGAADAGADGGDADGDEEGDSVYAPTIKALRLVVSDVRTAAALFREAALTDRAAETVEAVSRMQVDGAFVHLREGLTQFIAVVGDSAATTDAARVAAAEAAAARGGDADDDGEFGSAAAAKVDGASSLAAMGASVCDDVGAMIDGVIGGTQPLVNAGMRLLPDMSHVFAELVRGQLHHLLQWLADLVEALSSPVHAPAAGAAAARGAAAAAASARTGTAGDVPLRRAISIVTTATDTAQRGVVSKVPAVSISPAYAGVLAVACKAFCETGVTRVVGNLSSAMPRDMVDAAGVGGGADEVETLGMLIDLPDLIKRVSAASHTMLGRFVALHGERVAAMVRKSVQTPDWMRMREPRDARLVVEVVIDEVMSVRRQAANIFNEKLAARLDLHSSAKHGAGGGPAGRGGGGGGGGRGVQMDIERLFTEKQHIYDRADFTVDSVTRGVLKIVFKAFVECVRLCTFAKSGYQQIQVDVTVFQLTLPYLVDEPAELSEQLEEAVTSASERCVEPTPMESSVVLAIAQKKFRKLKLKP